MTQENIIAYRKTIGTERYQPLTDLINKINTCTFKYTESGETQSQDSSVASLDLSNSQSMGNLALQS